ACHAIDLPFTFGTLDRVGWDAFVAADADAHALSRRYRDAFAAFARAGDPACGPAGAWPPHAADHRATRAFGRVDSVAEDPLGPQRRLFEEIAPGDQAEGGRTHPR